MDTIAESEAKLKLYEQQLSQVNDMLAYDPQNTQFLQLKVDLDQVILLTTDLIKNTVAANSIVAQSAFVEAKAAPSAVVAPSSTGEIEIVKTGTIEVGETVEVSGDRVYAGVVTGIINETEYKVKYFEYDSEVSLPVSSLSRIRHVYPLIKPQSSVKIGMTCQCKYSADQNFYEAIITEITANGYQVMFPQYGNGEEVPYEYLTPSAVVEKTVDRAEETTAASTSTKDIKKAAGEDSALIPIPVNLQILPTDTEEEKIRKKKKIKAIKSKNRLISKDVEVQEVQKTWQNFVNKSSKKKSLSGPVIKKTSSLFKSSESVEGKVGVTNSGKAMTTFPERKKYTFQDGA